MSDSYAITIEAMHARTVRARVHLINFQFPEVPANKCLGLQLLADAHFWLRHGQTNQSKKTSSKLAARADARLVAYSDALQSHHDDEFNRRLAEQAESEILRVAEVENSNFEKTEEWHERNESGDPALLPFRDLNVVQILEVEVADARFLDHLVVGLRWETAMYARDERY